MVLPMDTEKAICENSAHIHGKIVSKLKIEGNFHSVF